MPSIIDATQPISTADLQPVDTGGATQQPPFEVAEPAKNPFLRTPLPPIDASSDSLRQFYGSGIPQTRVIPPQRQISSGGTTTTSTSRGGTTIISTGSGAGIPGPSGPAGLPGPQGPRGETGILIALDCQTYTGSLAGIDCN